MHEGLLWISFLVYCILSMAGCRSAYINGVNDGYRNTWNPQVRKILKLSDKDE